MKNVKRKNFNENVKAKYIASIIFNVLIVLMVIAGLVWGVLAPDPFSSKKVSFFRYFTTLSNLLMGVVTLIFLVFEFLFFFNKMKRIPEWVYAIKLMGSTAVTLTFLTVILFLAPVYNWQPFLFTESCFFYHLLVPIFAITTYIVFEHNKMHLGYSALSIAPVLAYIIFYCVVALRNIDPWTGTTTDWILYDWYQFVEIAGVSKVWIVILIMLLFTYLISLLLWFINRKIHIGEPKIPSFRSQILMRRNNRPLYNKYISSIALNIAVAAFVLVGISWGMWESFFSDDGNILRFFRLFTSLSNIFLGVVSTVFITYEIKLLNRKIKSIPKLVYLFKYIATVCIALTFMLTVCIFLPLTESLWVILGYDLILHILAPVTAIVTYIVLEHNVMKFINTLYALIPVVMYGIFYWGVALTHISPYTGLPPTYYDWYQFISIGGIAWSPAIFLGILALTYSSGCLIWLGNRKINIGQKQKK